MRWFATLVLALSLGVMGCSETGEGAGGSAGDGGDGGAAGVGGDGGIVGASLCEGVVCDAACKVDGVCNRDDGICDYARTLEDGTACGQGPGVCQEGVCVGGVFSCNLEGIQEAIKTGGGPHTFDCDGPTTIRPPTAGLNVPEYPFLVYKSVILDGEGNITLAIKGLYVVSDPLYVGYPMLGDRSEVEAGIVGFGIERHVAVVGNSSLDMRDCSVGYGVSIHPSDEGSANVAISDCDVERVYGYGYWSAGHVTLMLTNTVVEEEVVVEGSPGSSITLVNSVVPTVGVDGGMTLTLIDSTVSGGEGVNGCGTLIAANSAITNNEPGPSGVGGIGWRGALSLTNTTVSGNQGTPSYCGPRHCSPSLAGGLQFQYDSLCAAVELAVIHNSTIVNNDPFDIEADSQLDINGSVAGTCAEPVTSLGHNIESPGDTCGFDHETDQVNVSAEDLKLGELADNGGPTMTHALGAGSVAIDQILEVECVDAEGAPLMIDQRGVMRPQGDACDVGAVETEVTP